MQTADETEPNAIRLKTQRLAAELATSAFNLLFFFYFF